jgi:hypothetical protein
MEVGLFDLHAVCVSVSPSINFRVAEPIFMKLGMYIMAPELIYSSRQSVCLYMYPPIVGRQRLGKNVTTAKNTHATIELLDASFSMRPVSYQGK